MSKVLLTSVIVMMFLPGMTGEPPVVCQPPATVGRPYFINCTWDPSRANVHWALTLRKGDQTFLNPNNKAADPKQLFHANITELLSSGHSETQLWFRNVTQDDAGTLVQCVQTYNRKPSRHVVVSCRMGLCRGNGSVRCSVGRTRANHTVYTCGVESGSQTLRCGLRLEAHSVNSTAYKFDDKFKYGEQTEHNSGYVLSCQVAITNVEPGNYSFSGSVDAGCGAEVNVIHGIVIEASKPTVSLTYDPQTYNFCAPLKLCCDAHDFVSLSSFQWFLDGNNVTDKSKANCVTANSCSSHLKLTPSDFGKEVTCLATANQTTTVSRITTPMPPRKPPEFRNTSNPHNVVYLRMGEEISLACQDVEGNHTLKKLTLTCWAKGEIIASTYAVVNWAHLTLTGSQTLDRATCNCSAFYEDAKCIVLVSSVSIHVHDSSTKGGEQSGNISSHSWTSPGHTMTIVYVSISVIATILVIFVLGLVPFYCARVIRNSATTHQFSHIYEPVSTSRLSLREIKESEEEENQWTEAGLLLRPCPGRRILMDSLGYLLPRPNLPDIVNQHDNFNFLVDSSSATEYQETCFTSADSRRRNSDDSSLSLIEGSSVKQEDSPQVQKSQNSSHGRTRDFDEDIYITPLSLFTISDTASNQDICSKRDKDNLFESDHRATFCFRCRGHHLLPAVPDGSNPPLAVSSVFAPCHDTMPRDVNIDELIDSGRSCSYDEVLNADIPGADTPFPPQLHQQVLGADKIQHRGRRLDKFMSLGHNDWTRVNNIWPASNIGEDVDTREYSHWHPSKLKTRFHVFKSFSWPRGDRSSKNQGF